MQTDISQEEARALAQVLDTYEHIVQNQPDDYQSIEALKETYARLDRRDDVLRASKMLVNAYCAHGQFSQALMECEGILQREPGNAEVLGLIEELHKVIGDRLQQGKVPSAVGNLVQRDPPSTALKHGTNGASTPSRLITTASTRGTKENDKSYSTGLQGNQSFAAYLANQGLAPRAIVQKALESLSSKTAINSPAPSLLLEVSRLGNIPLESLLSEIVDRTGLPFIPIECYDVDRNVVQLIPDELSLGRLIIPFDQVGRVVYLAICNPFDLEARELAQQSLDYHIEWFLASPDQIQNRLAQIYRLPQPNP